MSPLCRQKSSRAPRASRWTQSGGENEHPCPQGDRSRAGGNACPEPTDSRWVLGKEKRRTQWPHRQHRREAQLPQQELAQQLHSLSSPCRVREMGRSRRITPQGLPPHPHRSGVDATLPAVPSHSPHRSQKGLQAPQPWQAGTRVTWRGHRRPSFYTVSRMESQGPPWLQPKLRAGLLVNGTLSGPAEGPCSAHQHHPLRSGWPDSSATSSYPGPLAWHVAHPRGSVVGLGAGGWRGQGPQSRAPRLWKFTNQKLLTMTSGLSPPLFSFLPPFLPQILTFIS